MIGRCRGKADEYGSHSVERRREKQTGVIVVVVVRCGKDGGGDIVVGHKRQR
jgi:hypothetical protein